MNNRSSYPALVILCAVLSLSGCVNTYVGVGGVTVPVPVYQPEVKKKDKKTKKKEQEEKADEDEENSSLN